VENQADVGLIAACQQGDPRSFQRLFEIYRDRVYALCRHMAGNDEDAEDLTQESFVWAFKNIGSFRAEEAVATLPEQQRLIFVLGMQMGMRYRETGAIVGCSEDAIKIRIHRARKRWRNRGRSPSSAAMATTYLYRGDPQWQIYFLRTK